MLNEILSLPIDATSEISIFGMDWLGNFEIYYMYRHLLFNCAVLGMIGCMYAIDTFDDTFSIHYAGDLVIPESLATLFSLKETLDLLFSFKHHHEKLAKIIQPAVEKSKISDQLRKLRPAITIHMKKETGPVVFFTPTNKRQRKSNIAESDDLIDK